MSSIDRGDIARRRVLAVAMAALAPSGVGTAFTRGAGLPVATRAHHRAICAGRRRGHPGATHLSEDSATRLGQQFYVENIAGAAGNIGTAQAARAAPDGYTVLFVFGSFVISPSLFAKPSVDPQKDFAPVTLAVTTPTVLVVNPSVPAQTVQELIEHIRANPGRFSFAHGRDWHPGAPGGRTIPARSRSRPHQCPLQRSGAGDRIGRRRARGDRVHLARGG